MGRVAALLALSATASCLAGLTYVAVANADVGDVNVVTEFDPAAFELPEGITVDKRGHIYVTMPFLAEDNVRRINPDGTEEVIADLPTGGGFGPLGLTVDGPGNLFVAVTTADPATQGVYRVTPDGGTERLAGSGAIAFANDLTFGDRGTLYIADSTGNVWQIRKGGQAELWVADELLEGTGELPPDFAIGANGITYRHGTVYVTNTEKGSIVAIPVLPDGGAGTPTVLAERPELFGADGVELDVHGNFYVNVIAQSTLVVVSADGASVDILADGTDGLDWASTAAFGHGRDRATLYTVNFAVGPFFGGGPDQHPAVLAVRTGAKGLPQP